MSMNEEARFEEWFQTYRRRTFGPDSEVNGRLEDHPDWSLGPRSLLLEGWMARAEVAASQEPK
jgi:hypothetical protein